MMNNINIINSIFIIILLTRKRIFYFLFNIFFNIVSSHLDRERIFIKYFFFFFFF